MQRTFLAYPQRSVPRSSRETRRRLSHGQQMAEGKLGMSLDDLVAGGTGRARARSRPAPARARAPAKRHADNAGAPCRCSAQLVPFQALVRGFVPALGKCCLIYLWEACRQCGCGSPFVKMEKVMFWAHLPVAPPLASRNDLHRPHNQGGSPCLRRQHELADELAELEGSLQNSWLR